MKEAYVKFETAKLLKEKGFDWECRSFYEYFSSVITMYQGMLPELSEAARNYNKEEYRDICSRPTQQMAMRWLWEEKGLNVNAIYGDYPALKKSFWMPQIDSLNGCYGVDDEDFFREYDSREECVEAALEYALTNLI